MGLYQFFCKGPELHIIGGEIILKKLFLYKVGPKNQW